jgi:hypothetical protein
MANLRSITLPAKVKADAIDASFEDGTRRGEAHTPPLSPKEAVSDGLGRRPASASSPV